MPKQKDLVYSEFYAPHLNGGRRIYVTYQPLSYYMRHRFAGGPWRIENVAKRRIRRRMNRG